jgi:hypothetical protein
VVAVAAEHQSEVAFPAASERSQHAVGGISQSRDGVAEDHLDVVLDVLEKNSEQIITGNLVPGRSVQRQVNCVRCRGQVARPNAYRRLPAWTRRAAGPGGPVASVAGTARIPYSWSQ